MPAQLVALSSPTWSNQPRSSRSCPAMTLKSGTSRMSRTIEEPHRQRIEADLRGRRAAASSRTRVTVFCWSSPNPAQAARWSMGVHAQPPRADRSRHRSVRSSSRSVCTSGRPYPILMIPTTYIGQEVDFAARLCAGAARGQVLISESAAALIRAAELTGVKIHPHGVRELKGIGAVPVFELLGENQRPRPPAAWRLSRRATLPPPQAHFIGRDDLIEQDSRTPPRGRRDRPEG